MQEFYTNTLESKFIKSLLSSTYIPTVQVWEPGKRIVRGFTYITRNYILEAQKDFPNSTDLIGPLVETDDKYFKIKDTYIFGKFYKGITSNFESNNSLYDSETHYYLGEYLRAYRDLFNIDLLPYYNCWGGQYSDKIRLSKVGSTVELNKYNREYNDGLKTLLVPIKFNQKYTIYIDSTSVTRFHLAYCEEDRIIEVIHNLSILNKLKNIDDKHIKFEEPSLSYSNPKLLEVNIESTQGEGQQSETSFYKDYLTLIIQLPEINTSSVLVLEGDYTENKVINTQEILQEDDTYINYNNKLKQIIFGLDNFKDLTKVIITPTDINNSINTVLDKKDINKYFSTSVPKLTQVFNNKTYAFSNRLIEYLTLNVITEEEMISNNIERIQEYIQSSTNRRVNNSIYNKQAFIKGVWDNNLRKYIYDEVTNRTFKENSVNGTIFDVNGFLDRDSEKIIMRGDK